MESSICWCLNWIKLARFNWAQLSSARIWPQHWTDLFSFFKNVFCVFPVLVTAISLFLCPQRKVLKCGYSAWWRHQFGLNMCEFYLLKALIFNPRFAPSPSRHWSSSTDVKRIVNKVIFCCFLQQHLWGFEPRTLLLTWVVSCRPALPSRYSLPPGGQKLLQQPQREIRILIWSFYTFIFPHPERLPPCQGWPLANAHTITPSQAWLCEHVWREAGPLWGWAERVSVRLLRPPTQCAMQEADAERLFLFQSLDMCVCGGDGARGGGGIFFSVPFSTGVTHLRFKQHGSCWQQNLMLQIGIHAG